MAQRWSTRKKINSCTDLISVCEFFKSKDSNCHTLSLVTGSAGVIPVGYILNKTNYIDRVIFDAPFLDVYESLCDLSQLYTTSDWKEFGNPIESELYKNSILEICPYCNIENKKYPEMLFFISLNDQNVPYTQSLKYISKVNSFKSTANNIFVDIAENETHFGTTIRDRKMVNISKKTFLY
ncbi:prolyl oligopeptidase family serine peptidase [Shewanella sp. YIC-542]|uniref:prolyl oligopeptidase family serine peptidase n=1 Tax=Shewanella mytili TaxID=3377111 RepID=UPI00398F702D